MSRLIAEIESFLLEVPLESICSGSIFYLTMNGDEVADYNTIRNSTERAVRSASQKIENKGRKEKVVNILMEITEIESFLLEVPLESICSGSIFYLTMNGDEVADYNTIRNSTERAVRSASQKIENKGRKEKVIESGYNTIIGLKALKALNINQESSPDYTQEDIAQNIRTLKMKLSSPMTDADVNLYGALKKSIDENLDISELTWKNPIASTVLSDELDIVKNLNQRQRRTFMEPRENMKCGVPRLISSRVDEFIENFNEIDNFDHIRNIMHDKTWKEDEFELLKTAERILGVL
ncbi:hypothetical protein Glove_287g54 [Diversispora epigaea]|uniref:Uncharacterized protein n=1 Tax=Diversispora epigaea TaxID=1348612 RepID=A0A397I4P1_9GLOM|nr:hypothetical protein Glove_287g54 [Diversispora epigaea]